MFARIGILTSLRGYRSGWLGRDATIGEREAIVSVALAAGDDYACAVLAGGSVECWGYNKDGQLGNGSVKSSSVPVAVVLNQTSTDSPPVPAK